MPEGRWILQGLNNAPVMGINEFQTHRVLILGSEDREGHRQVLGLVSTSEEPEESLGLKDTDAIKLTRGEPEGGLETADVAAPGPGTALAVSFHCKRLTDVGSTAIGD